MSRGAPVLLLGGAINALSILRSLSARGLDVGVASDADCPAFRSRYCRRRYIVPAGMPSTQFFAELLLGDDRPELHGSVVFACGDDAIEFMAGARAELERRYILDYHVPAQQLALLDKQETLRLARSVGCPAPQYWSVRGPADLDDIAGQIVLPAIIKPLLSHVFQQHYGKKLLYVTTRDELVRQGREVLERGLEVMVCEMIPGPDSLLSSYYTHLDDQGAALFHFTKRVIRRSPVNFGGACYHVTEWLPETAAVGEKFFRGIGFRGLGNIELKRDERDGQLKVIEVNARFTGGQELITRSGMDMAYMIYQRLTGGEVPAVDGYEQLLHMWLPIGDLDAFRELRRRGELSLAGWLRSVARRQVFPTFRLRDPWPAVASVARGYGARLAARLARGRR